MATASFLKLNPNPHLLLSESQVLAEVDCMSIEEYRLEVSDLAHDLIVHRGISR